MHHGAPSVLPLIAAAVGLSPAMRGWCEVSRMLADGGAHHPRRARGVPGRVPTTNVGFSVPRDPAVLQKALDAIHRVHSYEEPVVYVHGVWRTRHSGGDDTKPNKWWNEKKP
jgi:hypothetical protein